MVSFSPKPGHLSTESSGTRLQRLTRRKGQFDWKQKKVGGVTIAALSWWAWWGRRWRGRQGGQGSWAAARWPRRQPAGCSSSWRGEAASERGGDWGWWLRPAPTNNAFMKAAQLYRISPKTCICRIKTHLNPAERRKKIRVHFARYCSFHTFRKEEEGSDDPSFSVSSA